MKLRIFLLILISSFLLLISSSISEQKVGEIYSLTFSPSEPMVLQSMTINIGVQNTGNTLMIFKLKVFVIKDGQIKHQTNFEFDLQPGKTVSFSPSFTPEDIQEFEILAKLYDKYETELYDTKILKFNVISNIGPFDLFVEPLTRTISPESELPVSLTMINKGEKGTDVKIRVEVLCLNSTSSSEFLIFLEPKSSLEKIISMPTCKKEGLHTISSSLILFNRTWISSMNQFIVNESFFELTLGFPEEIEIEQGGSKTFDILIKNLASSEVTNLKLIIEKIPLEWVNIKPSSIARIEPNEAVLFIVNLSVPKDASIKEYPITLGAAANEVYKKEKSVLKVLAMSPAPEVPEAEKISLIEALARSISDYGVGIILILSLPVVAIAAIKIKKKVEEISFRKYKKDILEKLKSSIER